MFGVYLKIQYVRTGILLNSYPKEAGAMVANGNYQRRVSSVSRKLAALTRGSDYRECGCGYHVSMLTP